MNFKRTKKARTRKNQCPCRWCNTSAFKMKDYNAFTNKEIEYYRNERSSVARVIDAN